jgi:phospholipid/cholesterol/gamma-HCH transport system ATP-binding protein
MSFMPPTLLVVLRDLHFAYGERAYAWRRVPCRCRSGKVTALMGASGGGKTTVLRLIGGQYKAQSGQFAV